MLLPKLASLTKPLCLLCSFLLLLNSCQQNTGDTAETQASVTDTITTNEAETDTKAEDVQAVQAEPSQTLAENFPEDQMIQFTDEGLNGLCGHKYGCVEQQITPLGWSPDGKFAYFLEEANEAVQNTTIHFVIQDLATDEIVEQQTFKASEQAGYSEETDNYTVLTVWKQQEASYREMLERHNVKLGQGTTLLLLGDLAESIPFTFSSRDKMRKNELFAIKEVDQHWLVAANEKGGEKRIAQQYMGKYDLVLKTKPLGGFVSPFEERVAVLEGLEKRGYEGPPNVLRLQIVGCDLSKGFE